MVSCEDFEDEMSILKEAQELKKNYNHYLKMDIIIDKELQTTKQKRELNYFINLQEKAKALLEKAEKGCEKRIALAIPICGTYVDNKNFIYLCPDCQKTKQICKEILG